MSALWTLTVLLFLPLDGLAASQQPSARPEAPPAAVPTPRPPLPPPGEMARCKQLIDASQYAAARARLEPIVADHPGWARAALLLGLSYYRQSRFEVAKPLFEQALAADSQETAVRPLYASTLYALGELDAAETAWNALLLQEPDYAPAHYALGLIDLDRDAIEPGRRHFQTVVDLARRQSDEALEGRGHARLGDLHVRLGELEEARYELEIAIRLFPDEHDAHFKLSRVLERLGDAEGASRARQQFEEAKARANRRSRRRRQ